MTLRRALIAGGILLVLAMVIALASLIGGVYGRGGQQQGAEQASSETTQTQQAENTEQKTASKSNEPSFNVAVAGLGETVTFADRTLTINDIQRGYIFPSNIPKPTPGNEFIIASVTLTNTSSQPIPANSYSFESEDSTGGAGGVHVEGHRRK